MNKSDTAKWRCSKKITVQWNTAIVKTKWMVQCIKFSIPKYNKIFLKQDKKGQYYSNDYNKCRETVHN